MYDRMEDLLMFKIDSGKKNILLNDTVHQLS